MSFNKLQNSGFEYEVRKTLSKRYDKSYTLAIRNIVSKEPLLSIKTKTNVSDPPPVSKTFYGLDNRYYYVKLLGGRNSSGHIAGQVTPSGAVLGNDRSIIARISFYPVYMEGISKPEVIKPIIKTPAVPVVSAVPAVVSMPMPSAVLREEISWMKQIQSLITKIKNWITKILNR